MTTNLFLRDVVEDDLPIFFEHESDPDAVYMAAFTAKDPTDREAFTAHWSRILADPTVIIKSIVCDGQVVGHVLSFEESSKPEVSYWIGQAHWGQGIATWALSAFLAQVDTRRPMRARVAKDSLGSIRVLGKCGFMVAGEARGLANARGAEIDELVFELAADASDGSR
jgi:RimJ/RimL family protein N-acetyltransferase